MTILKTALALVFAVASTSASANIVEKQSTSAASEVSTCYYEGSFISENGDIYDVYTCYSNGNGSY